MELKGLATIVGIILAVGSILISTGILVQKLNHTQDELKELKSVTATKTELKLTEQKLDIYIEENAEDHKFICDHLEKIDDKIDNIIQKQARPTFTDIPELKLARNKEEE